MARGTKIAIATREAVVGDDLARLDTEVLERFAADAEAERVEHVEAMRAQMNAIRRMITAYTPAETGSRFVEGRSPRE